MKLKYDAMGIMHHSAQALAQGGETGLAYGLYELANNLRLLMRGEASLEEWNEAYVGADREPFDIDALLPVSEDNAEDEEQEED